MSQEVDSITLLKAAIHTQTR